jgi:hypothetical protein
MREFFKSEHHQARDAPDELQMNVPVKSIMRRGRTADGEVRRQQANLSREVECVT